jgi:hypothetical protein
VNAVFGNVPVVAGGWLLVGRCGWGEYEWTWPAFSTAISVRISNICMLMSFFFLSCASLDLSHFIPLCSVFLFVHLVDRLSQSFWTSLHSLLLVSSLRSLPIPECMVIAIHYDGCWHRIDMHRGTSINWQRP